MTVWSQSQNNNNSKNRTLSFNSNSDKIFKSFLGKPFWIWNKEEHRQEFLKTKGTCCFNHLVGLPVKNGREFPIFDYEKLVYDAIENNHNIWIKKSRGIGITTFLIRYLAWKILYSSGLDDRSIFIISGTREEFANYVKNKMESLFLRRFPNLVFESKYTELWIKRTWVKVFPTRNIKDVRGYFDVAYLFIDEADHGDKQFQEELEPAITAYEEKSKGKTIMVSTPNAPNGLFEKIELDPNSKYTKLKLDYSYGLDRIYDRQFIEKKKQEPEFEREFNLKYLGLIGDYFSTRDIDRAIELGKKYNPNKVILEAPLLLGLDPGFGSSGFGLVLLQVANGRIEVLLAEEERRARYEDIMTKVEDIIRGLNSRNLDQESLDKVKVFIDASNPEMVLSLKSLVGESTRWSYIQEKIEYCKKHSISLAEYFTVIPVPFGSGGGKEMLAHVNELLSHEKPIVAINPKLDQLITALRTARTSSESKLDKQATSYDNVLDAFMLACRGVNIVKREMEAVEYQ